MANLEMIKPIESPTEKLGKNFEKLRVKLKDKLEYKDSKWEKILMISRDNKISIYKAQDSNKDIRTAPAIWNVKSEYSLIRNRNWSFSLETTTFDGNENVSFPKSRNQVDNLDYFQLRNSIKVFERRINEANTFAQNKKNEKYNKMQQYAYNQEIQDKFDADILLQENWLA